MTDQYEASYAALYRAFVSLRDDPSPERLEAFYAAYRATREALA